ncbi:MAG TPA: sigma 54-interacting transcriptional regulator, partial [Aquaticitalea sp.]|nr:sigma 54-interacting transcriptional regulator [Aquaticitalea sp.]
NCAAIPDNLLESELFGYESGAFTGARKEGKPGLFELANGGTLLLDEIGDVPLHLQVKLLRTLQQREILRVGGVKPIKIDVRIIAITNKNLEKLVEKGDFREDLYHRLNEFSIKVPSLYQRHDDLILYADFFLEQANKQLNKAVIGFSPEVLRIFQEYAWPGNLRELSNVIKRATLLTQGEVIQKESLPVELRSKSAIQNTSDFSIKGNEKELIVKVLSETDNNKTKAAKLLNFSRKTLYNKLKEYGLD